MDQETGVKLTYEEKKKIKEDEKEKFHTAQVRQKIVARSIKFLVWAVIIALLGYGGYAFLKKNIPRGEDVSKEIPVMESARHIAVGESHEAYNSNPPTSGPHYADPAKPGFREEDIADGHLIHSMEHGLVWVSYNPRIGAEAEKLRKIPTAFAVVTKREANETDIALAVWGRLDTFNLEDGTIDENDLRRIRDFINRYANKGPEKIPAGQHGGI